MKKKKNKAKGLPKINMEKEKQEEVEMLILIDKWGPLCFQAKSSSLLIHYFPNFKTSY